MVANHVTRKTTRIAQKSGVCPQGVKHLLDTGRRSAESTPGGPSVNKKGGNIMTGTFDDVLSLTNSGDMSTLSILASIRDESLALFKKQDQHWVDLIGKLRERLESPFAKLAAQYLLEEKAFDRDDATDDERAAWQVAEAMMKQARPGFLQKLSQETSNPTRTRA